MNRLAHAAAILVCVPVLALVASTQLLQNGAILIDVDKYGDYRLSTTGGHPENSRDSNLPLLNNEVFGSSYIMVSVDGELGKFGWSSGENLGETVRRNADLVSRWKFKDVVFTQIISIHSSMYAPQQESSMRVVVLAENTTAAPKNIGFRVVLDPILGHQDTLGLFVPGRGLVTQGLVVKGPAVPDFFFVDDIKLRNTANTFFDFSGRDLVRPDELYIGQRRHINPSEAFAITLDRRYGNSFLRNSSLAYVWNPRALAPGRTDGIAYGAGIAFPKTEKRGEVTRSCIIPPVVRKGEAFWVAVVMHNEDRFFDTQNLSIMPELDAQKVELLSEQREFKESTFAGGSSVMASWKLRALTEGVLPMRIIVKGRYRNADIDISASSEIQVQ